MSFHTDDEIFNMKYYYRYREIESSKFKKDSKFVFDLTNIEFQEKIIFQFSNISSSVWKDIYEYEMILTKFDNQIIVNEIHHRWIHIGLEDGYESRIIEYY